VDERLLDVASRARRRITGGSSDGAVAWAPDGNYVQKYRPLAADEPKGVHAG
jgi:hypothetical protein